MEDLSASRVKADSWHPLLGPYSLASRLLTLKKFLLILLFVPPHIALLVFVPMIREGFAATWTVGVLGGFWHLTKLD